jgi:hypothetical protein
MLDDGVTNDRHRNVGWSANFETRNAVFFMRLNAICLNQNIPVGAMFSNTVASVSF